MSTTLTKNNIFVKKMQNPGILTETRQNTAKHGILAKITAFHENHNFHDLHDFLFSTVHCQSSHLSKILHTVFN